MIDQNECVEGVAVPKKFVIIRYGRRIRRRIIAIRKVLEL